VILVIGLNDSQHVTDAAYSVDTVQSTITSRPTDVLTKKHASQRELSHLGVG